MVDLLLEKINTDIEMHQFIHGKTGSVTLDIRDVRKLIEQYNKYKKEYLNELDKNRELKEKIEKILKEK